MYSIYVFLYVVTGYGYITGVLCANILTMTHLSDRVSMSLITICLSEGHPAEMYLKPSSVIWGERGNQARMWCVYMLESKLLVYCLSLFHNFIMASGVKPHHLEQNQHSLQGGYMFIKVAVEWMCVMLCSVHVEVGWVGQGLVYKLF